MRKKKGGKRPLPNGSQEASPLRAGFSLFTAFFSRMLSPSQRIIATTMRYAHLDQSMIKPAMEDALMAHIWHGRENQEISKENQIGNLLKNLVENGASDGNRTHGLQCHKLAL